MAEKIEFDLSVSNNGLDNALKSATKQASVLQQGLNSAVGFFTANIALRGLDALSGALKGSITDARVFSRGIAEINSILPKNAKLTDATTQSFIELSKQYGSNAQTQAKAFYNIVSAGVAGTANQLSVLKTANEAATAGLVDINTSATVLVSSVNAYAASGLTAKAASDSLFQAVKDGQTTFNELAASLGQVAPLASSAGVSFADLNGSIAFLTASGIKTPQAVGGIRAAITALIKPTSEAADMAAKLGLSFSAKSITEAGGLPEFFKKLKDATGGNVATLSKLFGSVEAVNSVLAITGGNFDKFTTLVDNNRKSLGATADAAGEVKKSLDFQLGQVESEGRALALTFGNLLVPVLGTLAAGLRQILKIGKENTNEYAAQEERLKVLAGNYNDLTDAITQQKKANAFVEAGGMKASEEALTRLNTLEALRNKVLKERADLRSFINIKGKEDVVPTSATPAVDTSADQAVIDARRETFSQLAIARAEFDAVNAQLDVDGRALSFETNQADLDALREFEVAKIDASLQAEIEKTNLIQDEKARRAGLDAIEFKKATQVRKLDAKRDLDGKKAQLALEQTFQNQRNAIILSSFGLASALAKDGSKTQFLIQKAGALAEIALARGKAIGLIPAQVAPIIDPTPTQSIRAAAALSLTTQANIAAGIGAATVAASAIKGFANGGIVGEGATSGPDNRVATVRDGEMILNASQQKNLFDAIGSGSFGGGDIVVQIDGRAVAVAIRNQVKSGFVLA